MLDSPACRHDVPETNPANPYWTVAIRARAEVTPDPDCAFANRIGAKYGADLRENDWRDVGRVVISFIPVKINPFS